MIVHILKNGKEVKSIEGHRVKRSDVPAFYDLLNRIEKEKANAK